MHPFSFYQLLTNDNGNYSDSTDRDEFSLVHRIVGK
jgi:hypothetical protein